MSKWFWNPQEHLSNVKGWRFRAFVWNVATVYLLLVGISTVFAQNEADSKESNAETSVETVLQEEPTTCLAESSSCPMQDGTCPMQKKWAVDSICHCEICGCHCMRPSDCTATPCCDSPVCQTLCAMQQLSGSRVKEKFRHACTAIVAHMPNRASPMLPDGNEMLSENEALSGNRAILLSGNKTLSGNRFCAKKSMNALFGINVMIVVNFDPDEIATTQSGDIEDVETEDGGE